MVAVGAVRDPLVSVGTMPTGVAMGTTAAYVADAGSNSVSVIDLTQNPPVVSATVPVGSFPCAASLSADGSQVFVPNFKGGSLSIIQTATNAVSHTVTVGTDPDYALQVGASVYVANLLSGTLSVVDPSSGNVTGTISLPSGAGGAAAPSGLAASSDGHTLYVNDSRNGQTDVVDLTATSPGVTGHVALPAGSKPAYLSVAGTTGYAAMPGSNAVSVLNLASGSLGLTSTVPVGARPYGVVAVPALNEVLATNAGSNSVSVIDTSKSPASQVSQTPVGSLPDGIAVSPDHQTTVIASEGDGTVNVFHVNQAPVNTVPGPQPQTVAANATGSSNQLKFSTGNSNAISTSDSDAGSNPVQITLGVLHGTLTLSQTTGLTFSSGSNGTAAMTFTGTLTDVNNALSGMAYTPGATYHGSDTLTLTDNDQGNTGLGKPQSATSTVSISVVNVAPTVGNVSYSGAVGNTTFGVGTSPAQPSTSTTGTVLSNSSDQNGDSLSAVPGTIPTAHGGSVSMNSGGTFTYTPPVGYTGNDTFTFQVSDGTATSSGTATITIANRVWYVNDTGPNGNGTSTSPFNNLASASSASSTGDYIFLYGSATSYTGGIALKASQTLVGQSFGLTIGGQTVVSASGSNPTIANAGGIGVTLGEGTTVDGIRVSGTSGAGMSASAINSFTLDASDAIASSTGDGLDITGGNGTINDGATISGSSAHAINITGRTGGTITNSGPITDNATGITMTNNTGATVNFTGKLVASTGTHTAFTATGGGTVSATASGSTLTTTTATALNVSSTTIGSGGLKFQSISDNGANPGISLSSTGSSGGLTVTGSGSTTQPQGGDGSGGTIQKSAGGGINLSSTTSPSFTDMVVQNNAGDGINGSQVNGLTLANSTVSGNGTAFTGSGTVDDGLNFAPNGTGSPNGLTGTVSIANSTITGSANNDANIADTSGSLNLTVTGSQFNSTSSTLGNTGLLVIANDTANDTVSVTGSTLSNNRADAFQFATGAVNTSASTGTESVTFSNNTVTGGLEGAIISPIGSSTTTLTVDNNNIQNIGHGTSGGNGIGIDLANSSTSGKLSGTVSGNTIGTPTVANSGGGNDMGISVEGAGTETLAVTNNKLYQYYVTAGIHYTEGQGKPTMNMTITGNTLANPGKFGSWGVLSDPGALTTDAGTVCAAISGNSLTGSGQLSQGGADIELDQQEATTYKLPGYTGSSSNTGAVQTFLQGNNNSGGTPSAVASISGSGGGFVGGSTCPTPS